MTRLFPKLYLDISSFWAGAILVVVLVILYLRFRKRINALLSRSVSGLIDFRESLSISSDSDYIQVLFKFCEGLHTAADFTPLSSILVPPSCIAPPPGQFPGKDSLDPSLIQQTLGYDPLHPELAAEFFSPNFPLADAVRTGIDLCLVGHPGSGKTTALAASMISLLKSRRDEEQQYRRIPFYIQVHHLLAQFPDSNILGVLLKAIQANRAFQTIPNFSRYLAAAIKAGQAVLYIDDMDLLPLADLNRVANFLTAVTRALPEVQLVATASPTNLGNIPSTSLEMISLNIWGDQQKYAFLSNLSSCWPAVEGSQVPTSPVQEAMLVVSDHFSTPLEFTLKSLAAFAGDIEGPSAADALSTHVMRSLSGQKELIDSLEIAALYTLHSSKSTFSRRDLNAWMADVYRPHAINNSGVRQTSFGPAIQAGIDGNLLGSSGSDDAYFTDPTLAGFLAARGLAALDSEFIRGILEKPDWATMHEAMRFTALFNDIKPYINQMIKDRSLLRSKLSRAAAWLPALQSNSPEEIALLKTITREINTSPFYLVKLRLVCALARSTSPAVKSIFQHLQRSLDPNTRRAAAIGSGMIKDLSAVPHLISQLNDLFPSNTAACYALGRIESPRSLEAIAEALLNGTELLRRAAAESLAQNRSEGHPALREGATRDDLLVRYAIVHGLTLIREDWSLEILDKMRIDEKEWVVRDLAQNSYQILQSSSPYLPHPVPPVETAPWMHEFAREKDLADPGPNNALDYLLRALETGRDEQKQDALAYLARSGNPQVVPQLIEAANGNRFDIAQQAELAIWYIAPPRYNILD